MWFYCNPNMHWHLTIQRIKNFNKASVLSFCHSMNTFYLKYRLPFGKPTSSKTNIQTGKIKKCIVCNLYIISTSKRFVRWTIFITAWFHVLHPHGTPCLVDVSPHLAIWIVLEDYQFLPPPLLSCFHVYSFSSWNLLPRVVFSLVWGKLALKKKRKKYYR